MSIIDDGGFTAYVPFNLEVEGRPELSLFPRNVAFSKKKNVDGKTIMGSALYEPDLETFRVWQGKVSLRYHNIHGGNCWLVIEYGPKYEYVGKKYINDKCVWESSGPGWKMFFVHFTMLGLADGERCEYEIIN